MLARLTALLVLTLPACVPTRGAVFGPVDGEVRRLGLDVAWGEPDPRVAGAVAELLKEPLALDGAIRIAMAQNRRLQARFEDLGVAAGRIAEATVLPATDVDVTYLVGGHADAVELTAVQDVLALVHLPWRRGAARAELAAAQARAVAATAELAARVEIAFDEEVAAAQQLELRQTALAAVDAALVLRQRMHAAGNTTDLAVARDLDQHEQAALDVGRAQAELDVRHAELGALLGLDDTTAWTGPRADRGVGRRLRRRPRGRGRLRADRGRRR